MWARLGRLYVVIVAAVIGLCGGGSVGFIRNYGGLSQDYHPSLLEYAPLPHHVPNHEGGTSFRFAMAHDVLHERYPKHGQAYYRERERLSRIKLTKLPPDAPAAYSLTDDLAASLERQGRSADAVAVMRDKLARQQADGIDGPALYSTYANLGTFLLHDGYSRAAAEPEAAEARLREGIECILKGLTINPRAHFGREVWELTVAEYHLAAMQKPALLETFDFVGNRLDLAIEEALNPHKTERGYGRPTNWYFREGISGWPKSFTQGATDEPANWKELSQLRSEGITKVGAEKGWEDVDVRSHRKWVPFDEPCLGIVGLWRQGGGPSPHFALALAETLLRVGQRYVAWTAYERVYRMADRYSPDPKRQTFLREHCRRRQAQIEETMTSTEARWRQVNPRPPEGTVEGLRPAFEAELAHGEAYQLAYQRYEETQIAAGKSIDDPKFYDEFQAGRPPIASPSGPEEWYPHVPYAKKNQYAMRQAWAWGLALAGVMAALAALVLRFWPRGGSGVAPAGLPHEKSNSEAAKPDECPDDGVA